MLCITASRVFTYSAIHRGSKQIDDPNPKLHRTQGLHPKEDCQHKHKSLSKHTPRQSLVSLNAENSDPQYSDSEAKPHMNKLCPLSNPLTSKNAHYYSVLPKSGSPLLQLNSPRQTNTGVTPSRDGGGQSWETKLKSNQVLRGKGLNKRTDRKLKPSTPKKKKDTVLTSSTLSSNEKTPEIKVGTTPPESGTSDCRRKLQLGTTEVISLLDDLDTENLNDNTEDIIITAIEDASTPTHDSCSTPDVDKSRKKRSLKVNKRWGTTPKCSVVLKPIVIRRQEATAGQDKPNSNAELTQDWLPLCNSLKEPPPSCVETVTQSVAAVHENEPCEHELESGPEGQVQTPKVATSTKKRQTRSSRGRKRDRKEVESDIENESKIALPSKSLNKMPLQPAKASKKTPLLLPSEASNKTPLSSRSVTRSVAHDYENALDDSLLSGDDDTIEPLSDSEVESESEFESPVTTRKRPLRNSTNTPAAKRQHLMTPRITTGKKKGRKTALVKKASGATPRRKAPVPQIPQKVASFADNDNDPFNIAREK